METTDDRFGTDRNGAGTGAATRWRGLFIAVPCFLILATGVYLAPRKAGYGTHVGLGLPSCGFKARTGYPCPTCGLTTSVCATVRGNLALAWRSHPFGIIFTLGVLLAGVCGTMELVAGIDLFSRIGISWWWAVIAAALLVSGWGINIVRCILD